MKKILKYVKIKLRGEVDVKKLQKLGLKLGETFNMVVDVFLILHIVF